MKKFLSLLLALTLVLSLVVVPARAAGPKGGSPSGGEPAAPVTVLTLTPRSASAKEGDSVIFDVDATLDGVDATISNATWVPSGGTYDAETRTYTVNAGNQSFTASCSGATLTTGADETLKTATNVSSAPSAQVTVTSKADEANAAFKTAVLASAKFTFNGRSYTYANDKVTAYKYFDESKEEWAINKDVLEPALGSNYDNVSVGDPASNKITVSAKTKVPEGTEGTLIAVSFDITLEVKTASFSIKRTPADGNTIAGGKVALATENAVLPSGLSYEWKYAKKAEASDNNKYSTISNISASFDWTVPSDAAGDYVVKCTAKSGETVVATATNTLSIKVIADQWAMYPTTLSTINLAVGQSAALPTVELYSKKADGTQDTKVDGLTYTWTSSNNSRVSVDNTTKKVTALSGASGDYTLTVSTTYQNKTYSQRVTVRVSSLSYELDTVANGSYRSYSISTLKSAASSVIRDRVGHAVTVNNLELKTTSGSASLLYGTLRLSGNSYIYTAPSATLGKATFVMTVTTTSDGSFDVTYTIPVIPIYNQTFEAQYPQAVSSVGNSYNYTVTAPTGYDRIALITKGTTPTTAQLTTSPAYNSTSITLNSSDFNTTTGKCTLYVMAWNSSWTSSYTSGKYYYGPLEVYQKNYNINYNGVTGETVQFAQGDFTDFMTEVAEARGDASKTKSYPYVTFDYVTFSLPTTAQGTLYYGGTAMSTSNSSGAFNTRTKVTNLDSVTFVPNAKTTAKTITLNFTLYATRYSSSSTSHGTTVPYSGSVVINLVREDIKYTVSQGDSVRFDESDFLSYLRSTKGYTSNYTIDYVTFDQSAVSAVNEGSLYTYYNGYNYGGSVKTTDKFYYNATASQNALSDVAFLASRYAKTGETVYIPFTIYARYGTTGTGTRQLTGTVAIKIGQTMNFIDVKTTDYFYNSVKWAVGKNITNGTSSTTFSPYKSCTRAEIVTFLWRAAGSPEPTITRNPFRDVNAVTHSSYYKAILWASQKGITSGTSATAFSPDQVCTRAQIVTFLYRYAGQPSGYYSNPFKDVGATSEASYYKAILWAVGKGITTGTSATTFSPYASCNRAEAVTFLYRYTNGL